MAGQLPQGLQTDLNLLGLNERLKALRVEFIFAVSKMESKAFSVKKSFKALRANFVETINSLIEATEIIIIPKDRYDDFVNGLTTLTEHGSFELLDYLNGLHKFKFFILQIDVALLSLQNTKAVPTIPSNQTSENVLDILDSDEFADQGYNNPMFEIEKSVTYYTIIEGDTLQSIAVKEFDGDATRWVDISKENQITDNDLIDGDLIGETIRIPGDSSAGNVSASNLVYEGFFDGTSQKLIDRFTYGRDIFLINGRMVVDSTNDIRTVEGRQGVKDNIQDRYKRTVNSLNPMNPSWGLVPLNQTDGRIPYPIMIERSLIDMENQATLDGRVLGANIDRSKIKIRGDRIDIIMEIRLIGSQIEKMDITVPQ